jgi:hypothetical protein
MRRRMIIGAVSATALTIGLGVGATLAAGEPTPPAPIAPVTMTDAMTGTHMNDVEDMTSMMNGNAMSNMMDASGMDSMHTTMHQASAGRVPADVLAACSDVHAAMNTAQGPSSTDLPSNHSAHHPGGQP